MSVLASLITALQRANGDRLVLCSGETPHVVAAGTRHDLGTTKASVKAVEALIQQILSPEARQEFAATNAALEPLSDAVSPIPLVVGTHRTGDTVRIELRRLRPAAPAAAPGVPASPPVAAEPQPATAPASVPDSPAVSSAVEPHHTDPRTESAEGTEWQPIAVPPATPEPTATQAEPASVPPDPVVVQPAVMSVEPVIAEPEPAFASLEPVVASPVVVPPAVASVEPVVAKSEPALVQSEPVVAPPPPVFVQPDPVVAQPEPAFASVELVVAPPAPVVVPPAVASVEPVVAESEPALVQPEPVVAPPPLVFVHPDPVVEQPEPVFASVEPVVAESVPALVQPEPVVAPPPPVFLQPDPVVAEPEPAFASVEPVVAEFEPAFVHPEPAVAPPPPVFLQPDLVVAEPFPAFASVEPGVAEPAFAAVEPVDAEPVPAFVQPEPAVAEPEPAFAQALAASDPVRPESAVMPAPAGDSMLPEPLEGRVLPPAVTMPDAEVDPGLFGQSTAFAESEPDADESSFGPHQLKIVPIAAAMRNLPATSAPDAHSWSEAERLDSLIGHAVRLDATDLYLRAGHAPVLRVRQRLQALGDQYLDRAAIDTMAVALAAGENDWSPVSDTAWTREFDGVGRVTCQMFTDDSGAGLVVHLSGGAASVLCKDIPRQVRRACEDDDGLVIVSAPALPEVMQMVAALGEWTAKRRSGYLISIEPPTGLGHDISGVLVSARRIAGTERDVADEIRRALHEGPDILVVALASGLIAEEAIRAAQSGCLVIVGVIAPTASAAIDTFLGSVNADRQRPLRQSFAGSFRCGFSYRALPGLDGARTIVQDLLIGTADVRAYLDRGDLAGLESLQHSGVGGMRSLDAALANAVHRRETTLRRAAGIASDRRELVRLVRRAARERNRAARGPSGRRSSDSAHSVAGLGA